MLKKIFKYLLSSYVSLFKSFIKILRLCLYGNSKPVEGIEKPVEDSIYPSFVPETFQECFTEDELYEIGYFMCRENDKIEGEYDITDETYQDYFKLAKKENFEVVYTDGENQFSILKKGSKHYFSSTSGCSCKTFEEEGFCVHMIINAISHNLIDPVNGIRIGDEELQEQFTFIKENIIDSPKDIRKIKTGFIKKVEISEFFKNKDYLEITTDLDTLVDFLTLDGLKDFIPTLKTDIPSINPDLRISKMSVNCIRNFIVENKDYFQKYFNDYAFVELKDEIQEKIDNVEELTEWIIYTQKHYE